MRTRKFIALITVHRLKWWRWRTDLNYISRIKRVCSVIGWEFKHKNINADLESKFTFSSVQKFAKFITDDEQERINRAWFHASFRVISLCYYTQFVPLFSMNMQCKLIHFQWCTGIELRSNSQVNKFWNLYWLIELF